jgi:hypothetical protein
VYERGQQQARARGFQQTQDRGGVIAPDEPSRDQKAEQSGNGPEIFHPGAAFA